ncbi:MAG: hypothetical protein HQL90_05620 [Magnetococcales bacterium]|nr:hypothetical protein [Magnetococcales bacterium]
MMTTYPHPNQLTPDQRLDEVAAILASGIFRLRLKKAQQREKTENLPLDNRDRMVPYGTPNPIDIERETP